MQTDDAYGFDPGDILAFNEPQGSGGPPKTRFWLVISERRFNAAGPPGVLAVPLYGSGIEKRIERYDDVTVEFWPVDGTPKHCVAKCEQATRLFPNSRLRNRHIDTRYMHNEEKLAEVIRKTGASVGSNCAQGVQGF